MKALLAAVILGGSFGSASATVESIDDGVMVAEITVEVVESAESVVAHLTFEDDDELTLPLLDRGDGAFGLRTELEAKNYFVVFETLGPDGVRSDPVSLAELGVDLLPESGATTTSIPEDEELSDDSERLLWLAVALGAASLSVLAFWVLGGRDEEEPTVEETGDPAEEE